MLGLGGGTDDPLLVSDTFTDSNGTALTAHTPDIDTVGSGWVNQSGTYQIDSNAAHRETGPTGSVVAIDAGNADVTVKSDISAKTTSGIVARLSDDNNYWLGWAQDGKLYENNADSLTERADLGAPTIPNTLELECNGSSITFRAETGLSATYASATFNQTATLHGLRSNDDLGIFDDFSVNSL